jgi:ectoine hydroxylase-related dioxygenase (phytanoyl-CoA dioxygenase family)
VIDFSGSIPRQDVLSDSVQRDGFAIVRDLIDRSAIESLHQCLEQVQNGAAVRMRRNHAFGIRDLLNVVPAVRQLAEDVTILSLAQLFVGEKARIVRALFFDKTREANWKVVWHQDLTIAVKRKAEISGFGPWTTKAGILHAQGPQWVLENIIALRIHLDDADESNGALRVIPGSHRRGRLTHEEIEETVRRSTAVTCCASEGSVLAMRPLLLHSSRAGTAPKRRRVIHLEFAGIELPNGIEWIDN